MNRVEVAVSGIASPRWKGGLAAFCRRAMSAMAVDGWIVSVLLCDDRTIRALNARYRGKDAPTDVLSFRQDDEPSPGDPAIVGDLVISVETARANARERGVPEEDEIERLAVHGLLHLAGMDHGRGKGPGMLRLQESILTSVAVRRGPARRPPRGKSS